MKKGKGKEREERREEAHKLLCLLKMYVGATEAYSIQNAMSTPSKQVSFSKSSTVIIFKPKAKKQKSMFWYSSSEIALSKVIRGGSKATSYGSERIKSNRCK